MNGFGMQDLLQKQIQDSCRLALPNGLQDLMYDISREVLRAQPTDVYTFITNYLAALLVTRENLAVSSRVCAEVCENICHLGLRDELLEIGLSQEDVDEVKKIVEEYFACREVKESNLLMKLMRKTEIDEELLPEILNAIRRAFMRYQAHNTTVYESSSDSDMDEVTRAAHHTIKLYRHTRPTEADMDRAALRIQTAYRAYGVRRQKAAAIAGQQSKPATKNIRFGMFQSIGSDECSMFSSRSHSNEEVNPPVYYPRPEHTSSYNSDISKLALSPSLQNRQGPALSVSSTSLAGSFLKLPKHIPYSAHHDTLNEIDEHETEKESSFIDYTKYSDAKGRVTPKKHHGDLSKPAKKTISFHSIHEIINDKISLAISESTLEEEEGNQEEQEAKGSEECEESSIEEVIVDESGEVNEVSDEQNFVDEECNEMREELVDDHDVNQGLVNDVDHDLEGNEVDDFSDDHDDPDLMAK